MLKRTNLAIVAFNISACSESWHESVALLVLNLHTGECCPVPSGKNIKPKALNVEEEVGNHCLPVR